MYFNAGFNNRKKINIVSVLQERFLKMRRSTRLKSLKSMVVTRVGGIMKEKEEEDLKV